MTSCCNYVKQKIRIFSFILLPPLLLLDFKSAIIRKLRRVRHLIILKKSICFQIIYLYFKYLQIKEKHPVCIPLLHASIIKENNFLKCFLLTFAFKIQIKHWYYSINTCVFETCIWKSKYFCLFFIHFTLFRFWIYFIRLQY